MLRINPQDIGVKAAYWAFLAISIVATPHIVPMFIQLEDDLLQDFVEAFASLAIGAIVTVIVVKLIRSKQAVE